MAEAKLNREYAARVAGVGVLLVGICLWSLYDGRTAWPRQNRVMERVRPALLATNLTAEAWLSQDGERGTRLDAAFRSQGVRAPAKLVRKLGELRIPDSTSLRPSLLPVHQNPYCRETITYTPRARLVTPWASAAAQTSPVRTASQP